ncbi:hypothetical protein LXM63_08270 [Chryseobacterium gleum]|uniref:hypothetical protein n=1 Tax=Chryseobacterium gleum TaxID=250 RepID=UPI001E55FE51|nr:hypothetical protein [Chryseobacterium gleum]MCE4065088.1 hypothetical protein [Chryseobacterium gleum]
MKKKLVIAINFIVFIFTVYVFLLYYRENKIKTENLPIECSIIKLDCAGSSRDHPKVLIKYKQKNQNVDVKNCDDLEIGYNSNSFYYDSLLDRIFYVDSEIKKGCFIAVAIFIFSLLFWIIPKDLL